VSNDPIGLAEERSGMRTHIARIVLGVLVALVSATSTAAAGTGDDEVVAGSPTIIPPIVVPQAAAAKAMAQGPLLAVVDPLAIGDRLASRYARRVFDDVEHVGAAIEYRRATDYRGREVRLHLDIWQPAGDQLARRPVMVWMHGGGWAMGQRSLMGDYARDSAQRGYVGVTIDYRLEKVEEMDKVRAVRNGALDAIAAVRWLQANAARYRIDPTRIVTAGYSAGATNAIHSVTLANRDDGQIPVAGAVAVAGYSFTVVWNLDFGSFGRHSPPIALIGTEDDPIVPHERLRATCAAQQAAGGTCQLTPFPSGGHGFIGQPEHQAAVMDLAAAFVRDQVLGDRSG
jgi:acetyl esterase/lipase